MTVTLTPADFLSQTPGWESATVAPLSGGLTNKTWRITAGDRAGVLKLDDGPREIPLNTRFDEANVQKMAAMAGLAPNVLHAGSGFYFSEYVEGTVWSRDCLDKAGNLEMIAAALKRLHALPLTGRSFDASIAAKRYAEKVSGLDAAIVNQCTEIVATMRLPHNLCCCHNDLVAQNLVTTPDLVFLDWEYSCDNDPFFDLATVVEHHELSDDQVSRFLDAYLGGDGSRWRLHLEKQRTLYLALLCLWMGARTDSEATELQNVADRLATSCS